MKTFKNWFNDFIDKKKIALNEEGVDLNYLNYKSDDKLIGNNLILRRFDQLGKWVKTVYYLIVGIG